MTKPENQEGKQNVEGTTKLDENEKPNETSYDSSANLIANLSLSDQEKDLIKNNKNILEAINHNLKAKRDANEEAKNYRQQLEKIQSEIKAKENEKLEKQGEFEKLYKETKDELERQRQEAKNIRIQHKIEMLAQIKGIKKVEYVKLFDKSLVEVDKEGKVKNLDELFEEFYVKNPDLFGKFSSSNSVIPDSAKPTISTNKDLTLDELREKANRTRTTRDMALYLAAQRKANN